MRTDSLPTIEPLKTELIPPDGAQPIGVHTDGRVIYERKILDRVKMAKTKTQKLDPETGEPLYRRHPTTGEKVYPIMELKKHYRTQRFVLNRDGHGNVYVQEHFERTAEEVAHLEKLAAKREFNERLAEIATEKGLTADELVLRLTSRVGSVAPGQVIVEIPEDEMEYPFSKGGGHWILSDGSAFRGSRDAAMEAEAKLIAAAELGVGFTEAQLVEEDEPEGATTGAE